MLQPSSSEMQSPQLVPYSRTISSRTFSQQETERGLDWRKLVKLKSLGTLSLGLSQGVAKEALYSLIRGMPCHRQ